MGGLKKRKRTTLGNMDGIDLNITAMPESKPLLGLPLSVESKSERPKEVEELPEVPVVPMQEVETSPIVQPTNAVAAPKVLAKSGRKGYEMIPGEKEKPVNYSLPLSVNMALISYGRINKIPSLKHLICEIMMDYYNTYVVKPNSTNYSPYSKNNLVPSYKNMFDGETEEPTTVNVSSSIHTALFIHARLNGITLKHLFREAVIAHYLKYIK